MASLRRVKGQGDEDCPSGKGPCSDTFTLSLPAGEGTAFSLAAGAPVSGPDFSGPLCPASLVREWG